MKKIIPFLITLGACLCFLTGCLWNTYHAVVCGKAVSYEGAKEYLDKDFLEENRTYGAFYPVGAADSESGEDYIPLRDDSYPSSRSFLLKSREEWEEIFLAQPMEWTVDFEREMLVIYTFTSVCNRPISVKRTETDADTLKIGLKMASRPGVDDASVPGQLYLFIKLDRLDVTAVEVELT